MNTPESINLWLKDHYGCNVEGHPLYRVVWSTGLTENRFGEFEETTEAGIFLRSFTGVREVLKYPFSQNRYVLEKFEDNPAGSDIVGVKFTYEPMYVFQNKKSKSLPLDLDIVNIAILSYLNRNTSDGAQKSRMSQLQYEEDDKTKKRKETINQLIGENMSTPHLMDLVY